MALEVAHGKIIKENPSDTGFVVVNGQIYEWDGEQAAKPMWYYEMLRDRNR